MSLISEALKSAQKQRDQFKENQDSQPDYEPLTSPAADEIDPALFPGAPVKQDSFFTRKRLLIYSLLLLTIVIAVIIILHLASQQKETMMKALTSTSPAPASQPQTNPPSAPVTQIQSQITPLVSTREKDEKTGVQSTDVLPVTPSSTISQPGTTPAPAVTPTASQTQPDTSPVIQHSQTVTQPSQPVESLQESKPQPRYVRKKKTPPEPPSTQTEVKETKKEANIKTISESTDKDSPDTFYQNQVREGDRQYNDKNFYLAIECYKKGLQIKKEAELYLKIYSAYLATQNTVLAYAHIDEGLKHFPDDFFLNKIAAIRSLRRGDYRKALVYAEKALAKDNLDYALYTYSGLCYLHRKNYTDAMVLFEKSLEINSDAVENYYYIGLIYDNQQKYDRALEYYRVFLKLNPGNKNFKHRAWIIQRIDALEQYLNRN